MLSRTPLRPLHHPCNPFQHDLLTPQIPRHQMPALMLPQCPHRLLQTHPPQCQPCAPQDIVLPQHMKCRHPNPLLRLISQQALLALIIPRCAAAEKDAAFERVCRGVARLLEQHVSGDDSAFAEADDAVKGPVGTTGGVGEDKVSSRGAAVVIEVEAMEEPHPFFGCLD